MEFDKSKVYSSVNADELKIGSKVVIAKNISSLKDLVYNNMISTLIEIYSEDKQDRFHGEYVYKIGNGYDTITGTLCYLISDPEEKKLKWTDLKIKDVIKRGKEQAEVIYINEKGFARNDDCHICIGCFGILADIELEEWEKVE